MWELVVTYEDKFDANMYPMSWVTLTLSPVIILGYGAGAYTEAGLCDREQPLSQPRVQVLVDLDVMQVALTSV